MLEGPDSHLQILIILQIMGAKVQCQRHAWKLFRVMQVCQKQPEAEAIAKIQNTSSLGLICSSFQWATKPMMLIGVEHTSDLKTGTAIAHQKQGFEKNVVNPQTLSAGSGFTRDSGPAGFQWSLALLRPASAAVMAQMRGQETAAGKQPPYMTSALRRRPEC